MKRNVDLLPEDKFAKAVGLPFGFEGAYFVSGGGAFGQAQENSIINHNEPPSTQPGLWCNWTVGDEDGNPLSDNALGEEGIATTIVWDEGEKFYNYVEWLQYLIDHFVTRWGYTLNGSVEWRGEEWSDNGVIDVVNNVITVTERG